MSTNVCIRLLLALTLVVGGAGCLPTEPTQDAPPPQTIVRPRLQPPGTREDTQREAITVTRRSRQKAQLLHAAMDPSQDGWASEVVGDRISSTLNRLAASVIRSSQADKSAPSVRLTEDFKCGPLRPATLTRVHDGPAATVYRRPSGEPESQQQEGRDALDQALQALAAPMVGDDAVRTKIKVFEIKLQGEVARARAVYEAVAEGAACQQRATWLSEWRQSEDGQWALQSLRATDYEESVSPTGSAWYADVTQAVLGSNTEAAYQLSAGMEHWLQRIEERHGIHDSGREGLAVGDANGDGLDDVYVCQTGGLPNRLFLQQRGGTALDVSSVAGVDFLDQTSSALLIDLDNNGAQDLVLALRGTITVLRNDGGAHFSVACVHTLRDDDTKSLSAADYDGDGDLDIYVCVDLANAAEGPRFQYHNANDGGQNVLLQNQLSQGAAWSSSM